MERILSIDYGKVRTGLAVTDALQLIASPLETVETVNLKNYLDNYFSKENVEIIVVGYPLKLDGSKSETTLMVDEFISKLNKWYPKKTIRTIDERLSSVEASKVILQSGIKKSKRRNKGLVDKVAAVILLQSYLERKYLE